jgi:hypothetical protein
MVRVVPAAGVAGVVSFAAIAFSFEAFGDRAAMSSNSSMTRYGRHAKIVVH